MEIRRYFALVRYWLWAIILGGVLAGIVTYLILSQQIPIYSATSRYVVESRTTGSSNDYGSTLNRLQISNEVAQLMVQPEVLQAVAAELGLDPSGGLPFAASASVVPETAIVNVTVRDANAQRASDVANAIGRIYNQVDRERKEIRYTDILSETEERLQSLDQTIAQLEEEINILDQSDVEESVSVRSRLERQLNEAQEQYNLSFTNKQRLDTEQANSLILVASVNQANTPRNPVSPRTQTNTILAILTGAALTLGVILLVDYLDDSVKTPDQIFDETGMSVLATIAFIKGTNPSDRLITHHSPRDPISEAFRVLRTNLNYASIDTDLDSILVTSSSPGEGKSTTTSNLAVVMAQTGKRVVLVDADLRRPSQQKIFGKNNNQGLTTALLDTNMPVTSHLQATRVPGLQLMLSGPMPPNPSELLNSERMSRVLEELKEVADLIIVDTPPVLTVADAAILANKVNGSALIAETGETRMESLVEAKDRLARANPNILGTVLNRAKPARNGYYRYYYDYRYHSYEYQPANDKKKNRGWVGRLTGLFT